MSPDIGFRELKVCNAQDRTGLARAGLHLLEVEQQKRSTFSVFRFHGVRAVVLLCAMSSDVLQYNLQSVQRVI